MLNRRPYVVRHVPRGLSSWEEEFEGLLRGNNSSTKMISLSRDGPVKREVTHLEGAHFGSSLSPVSKRTQPGLVMTINHSSYTFYSSHRSVLIRVVEPLSNVSILSS
jgi:hypothetical protein